MRHGFSPSYNNCPTYSTDNTLHLGFPAVRGLWSCSNGPSFGHTQALHLYRRENTILLDIPAPRDFPAITAMMLLWVILNWCIRIAQTIRSVGVSPYRTNGSSLGSNSPSASPRPEGNRVRFFRHRMPDFLNNKKQQFFPWGFFPNRNISFVFSIILRRAILQEEMRTDRWTDENLTWKSGLYTYNKCWNIVGCATLSTIKRVTDVSEERTNSIFWFYLTRASGSYGAFTYTAVRNSNFIVTG